MAHRLFSANFPLTVYNRNRDKCVPFANAGALVADSPRQAGSRAQVVISMVADDRASRAVWLGESGILAGISPGALLIESSTLSVAWVKELATAAADRGCRFLDAPVTGTKPHAANGELLFLVGGETATIDAARPVFSVLGREVLHLGPTGSGALMKLINNFVCGVQAASFAEALALVDSGGLDRQKAMAILNGGAPGSGIFKRMAERITANDFTPVFALRWMAKDLSYAVHEGLENRAPLKTADAALSVFERAVAEGRGDEDFSAVIKSGKSPRQ